MKKFINWFISIIIIVFGFILMASYVLPGIFLILCGLTISPLFYKIINEKIKYKLIIKIIVSISLFLFALETTPSDTNEESQDLNKNNINQEIISENTLKEDKNEVIHLKFGEIGSYGKQDKYNIRYYIPSGNYKVIDNTGSSYGFFIVKNEKIKNSEGKLEDVILEDVRFGVDEKSKNITIPEGSHIILFGNSDFNLERIDD